MCEKPLAKRPMHSKRIGIINTNQSVSKKNKIVQNKKQAAAETDGSLPEVKRGKMSRARRPSTSGKSVSPRRKKSAPAQKRVTIPSEAGATTRPSDEEIRLRAYFISERRRRFALPGDADSDWLEARRQLLSEIGPR
jgi:hypothetical protein